MLIALQTLRWGDGEIQPGESVPEGEAGRDYDALLRLHLIADAGTADGLRAELAKVTAERDALKADDGSRDHATSTVTADVGDAPQVTEALAKAAETIDDLTTERDVLTARVAELEAELAAAPPHVDSPDADAKANEATAATPDPDALPDGWTETSPGWFKGPNDVKIHGRAALDAHLAGQQE